MYPVRIFGPFDTFGQGEDGQVVVDERESVVRMPCDVFNLGGKKRGKTLVMSSRNCRITVIRGGTCDTCGLTVTAHVHVAF